MAFEQKLDIYLRSRFTLIVLVSTEEERALHSVKQVCDRAKRPCLGWDVADGFQAITNWSVSIPTAHDPFSALKQIEQADSDGLFVLKDFHDCWSNPQFKRKLRSVAQKLKFSKKSILITVPSVKIPLELRDETVIIEFPLPETNELETVLQRLSQTPGVRVNLTKLGREKLVQAALGLTAAQAQRVFTKAIVSDGVLDDRDINLVIEEKKQIIRESQALEFYTIHETPRDVGGLAVLKEWLRLRKCVFSQAARNYGLPAPKGIALIGISGTGKSLAVKMISSIWRLPLLHLELGSLLGSLIGESAARTQRALQLAERVAPCILWIDEIEKAFGGRDDGVSKRLLGTILIWMQNKTAPCFVVATANNISNLPPELLRKGRFDEIFFLDLPTVTERQEILNAHLSKRNRLPKDFDVAMLARQSEGYVGAEIEQAIIDGMYFGFNQGREFTTKDISHALKRQVPLSVSQQETITELRNWLKEGRAQSASFEEIKEAEQQFVPLQSKIGS
ncbi:AAA family ATPase [Pleurocapsa sp. PCC 7319]|uniref:AAA family ATPase n=1 Tax=Pleurocapsa sp. PCC 7319 TaxID=118161 RepID=UPI000347FAB4|nr:AAA family ATPase [Pleurocapsa sp. PCC 7319]